MTLRCLFLRGRCVSCGVYSSLWLKLPRRNRQRNVIWFNPPFSKNVKTNIACSFLHLVDTHFPAGHKLHKIFNRNTVKVSYSCMNNVRSIITNHNTRIIRKSQTQVTSADNCNCRNKEACPLQNKWGLLWAPMSPNIAQHHLMSPNIAYYRLILPIITWHPLILLMLLGSGEGWSVTWLWFMIIYQHLCQ